MLDSGKTKEMINMENTLLEMQQKLTDGYCVGFLYANESTRFLLGKSDEFNLLNDNIIAIHKENGIIQIINLNFISEIRIIRKSYK